MHKPLSTERKNGANTEVTSTPVESYVGGVRETMERLPYTQINRTVEVLVAAYRAGRSVFLFGNGGSAALASHLACDLGKGTVLNGNRRFRVLSLTDNVPLMTAWANDARYADIFAEQLRNLVQREDVAFAISGSGNSPNVLQGLRVANEEGAHTIVLTGYQGGKAAALAEISIIVPSDDMQHIEDLHLTIAHSIFRAVREVVPGPVGTPKL